MPLTVVAHGTTGAPPFGASAQPFPAAIPGSSAVADLGAALRRGGTVGDVPRQLYQHEAMLENSKKCGTEVGSCRGVVHAGMVMQNC